MSLENEALALAEMIRARMKRVHKETDILRRLTAQQEDLARRIAEAQTIDTPEGDTTHGTT